MYFAVVSKCFWSLSIISYYFLCKISTPLSGFFLFHSVWKETTITMLYCLYKHTQIQHKQRNLRGRFLWPTLYFSSIFCVVCRCADVPERGDVVTQHSTEISTWRHLRTMISLLSISISLAYYLIGLKSLSRLIYTVLQYVIVYICV